MKVTMSSHRPEEQPWQLRMFRHTLKKQQKLAALLRVLGDAGNRQCLLITCGDNNGALNWHLREHGGLWRWADAEAESVRQISDLTGDPVVTFDKEQPRLPFPDEHFDLVVTIDVHEHLPRPEALNRELARLVRPGGRVIVTTPGGENGRLANRIKRWVGMHTADYGHYVDGYNRRQLEGQLHAVGLRPHAYDSYSRFFTELLELAINFVYVKVLARKSKAKVEQGQIAPQSQEQLAAVEKSYKTYARAYPVLWLLSRLDLLLFFSDGYAPVVAGRKES